MAHVRLVNMQYNMPPIAGSLDIKQNRTDVAQRFLDESARMSVAADLETIDFYDGLRWAPSGGSLRLATSSHTRVWYVVHTPRPGRSMPVADTRLVIRI